MNENKMRAYSWAIKDIKNGILTTLWVNQLKKEYPELYEYALNKNKG